MSSVSNQPQLRKTSSKNFSRPDAYSEAQKKRHSAYATDSSPFVLASGSASGLNLQKELPTIPQEPSSGSSGGIGHLSDSEDEETRKVERKKNAFGEAVTIFSKIMIGEKITGRNEIAQRIQQEIEAKKIANEVGKDKENLSPPEINKIVNTAIAEQMPSPEKLLETAQASPNVMETAHIIHGMNKGLALVYNPIQDILEKAQQADTESNEQKNHFEGEKLRARASGGDETSAEKSLQYIENMKKVMEELTTRRVQDAVEPLVETAATLFREAVDKNDGTKSDTYIRMKSYCKALSEIKSQPAVEETVGGIMLGEIGTKGSLEKMADSVAQEDLETKSKSKASSIKNWIEKIPTPKLFRKKTGSSISEPQDAEGAGLDRNDLRLIRTNESQ